MFEKEPCNKGSFLAQNRTIKLRKRGGAYYEEKVNFVHFGLNNGSKPAGMLWLKQKRGRFRCFGCIPNLGY